MSDTIKSKVKEFSAIAKELPDNLQKECFELLLSDYLERVHDRHNGNKKDIKPVDAKLIKEGSTKKQKEDDQDIIKADLHVKARHFIKTKKLTLAQINQLFYKEKDSFLPLFDDLGTTQACESQIRIAILQALKNAIRSGDFNFNGEEVREECKKRKCYDQINFATNFKTNKQFFDGLEGYKRTSPVVKLSSGGKDKLAELIKELQ